MKIKNLLASIVCVSFFVGCAGEQNTSEMNFSETTSSSEYGSMSAEQIFKTLVEEDVDISLSNQTSLEEKTVFGETTSCCVVFGDGNGHKDRDYDFIIMVFDNEDDSKMLSDIVKKYRVPAEELLMSEGNLTKKFMLSKKLNVSSMWESYQYGKVNLLVYGYERTIDYKALKPILSSVETLVNTNNIFGGDRYDETEYNELYDLRLDKMARFVVEKVLESCDSESIALVESLENELSSDIEIDENNYIEEFNKIKNYEDEIKDYVTTLRYQEEFEGITGILDTLKQSCEEIANTKKVEINSLISSAKESLSLEDCQAVDKALENIKDSPLFADVVKDWDKEKTNIYSAIAEKEKQANIDSFENLLSDVENSLDTEKYDQLKALYSEYSAKSEYKDVAPDWKKRMDAISDAIEKKKQEERIQEYKDSCVTPTYDDFFRNSDDYYGKDVHFRGEIIQVISQDANGATLRVDVTKKGTYSTYYTDTIYVDYDNYDEIETVKLLEGDIIDLYGIGSGEVTYTTVLGASMTIPSMDAIFISLVK